MRFLVFFPATQKYARRADDPKRIAVYLSEDGAESAIEFHGWRGAEVIPSSLASASCALTGER